MRYLTTLILLILILSGSASNTQLSDQNDHQKIDKIYGPGVWDSYFKTRTTPLGWTLRLKIVDSTHYQIQWGTSQEMFTYPQLFLLDGHETWLPRFIDESKNFIVLRQGCGSPCWIGYFLPASDTSKTQVFSNYFTFDLKDNLVAYPGESNIIITNIISNDSESHQIGKCDSFFLGYCIDSLTIKDKILKYKWLPFTFTNQTDSKWIMERIKI